MAGIAKSGPQSKRNNCTCFNNKISMEEDIERKKAFEQKIRKKYQDVEETLEKKEMSRYPKMWDFYTKAEVDVPACGEEAAVGMKSDACSSLGGCGRKQLDRHLISLIIQF